MVIRLLDLTVMVHVVETVQINFPGSGSTKVLDTVNRVSLLVFCLKCDFMENFMIIAVFQTVEAKQVHSTS